MTIRFFHPEKIFGFLSNFSSQSLQMKGKVWPTVEHYYQAQKFAGTEPEEEIRCRATPKEAKKMAHAHEQAVRPDWDNVKLAVMRKAVLRKFATHDGIRKRLIKTGEDDLVEDSQEDLFWGRGWDGSGQNMLGKILMEVRQVLRDQPSLK